MGHSYNNGLHTTSKGVTYDTVCVTGLNVANGSAATIAEDCKSGLIASVTHTGTGIYTFQLSRPYPPKRVIVQPELTSSAGVRAVYKSGSYDPTTGQFIVNTYNSSAVLTDGGGTDELHVLMAFNRYKN